MKKKTLKLCSAILSATTLMSMFTVMPASAVDSTVVNNTDLAAMPVNTVDSTVVSNAESNTENTNSTYADQENLSSTYVDENGNVFTYGTGDLTLEEEIPEDVTVIGSANEYYSVKGKKVKIPSGSNASVLPSSVDNSQSEYFPEIKSQGGIGSCVAWAQAYYQFTYTMNKARGVATTPENTFSPKFVYNAVNNGVDEGSVSDNAYEFMKYQGNVPISMVPYDDDYLSWSPTEKVWTTSLKYRVADYQSFETFGGKDTQITSVDDADIEAVKTSLSNGDVLAFSTHISSFVTTKLKENANAPENSKYAGEQVVVRKSGYEGSHRMTLVGYNDNIWTDINENGNVDAGEMGAFKIANSWGDDYANDGFIWVAYDALNSESAVEGAPEDEARSSTINWVTRIDVVPYDTTDDLYFKYTWNTSNRNTAKATVTAELNGTIYSASIHPTFIVGMSKGEFSFDGTTNSNDGTMALALNNVFPEITSENLDDFTWSVTFSDSKDDDTVLTVKDAQIVDASTNTVYTVDNVCPFELDGSEKTVELHKTSLYNAVIYYRGYDEPNLNYKIGNGAWLSAQGEPMEYNIERRGYLYKYIVEMDEPSDVTLYFSDNNGNVDNNSGQYYTASSGLNYFVTENVAEELEVRISDYTKPIGTSKLVTYYAEATGGYAPYQYQFIYENLDTGDVTTRKYSDTPNAGTSFSTSGNYRITVNVKDYSDNVATSSIDLYFESKPFQYTEFSVTPDKEIMVGDTLKFTAVSNFESITYVGRPKNTHNFTIKNSDGDVVYTTEVRATEYSLSYKTSTLPLEWMPREAGSYSITVSSTDGKDAYAERTLNFDVAEYNGTIVGDADNNKEVNIKDALQIMKYNVGAIESSELWLRLSDGNKDDVVDIKDAIHILKYVVMSDNIAYVGEVNYKELPTEPPTEAPTDPPTEEPTDPPVEENTVTFTNSYSWGGTIYCYYWSDSDTNMTSWPGKAMTSAGTNSYGEKLYTYEVPDDATYIIFTNGSYQTVDISYSGGEVRYYPTKTDSKGHYYVETW